MPDAMTQIKFTIDAGVVSAFKARCKSQGVSMTSVISQFMKTNRPVNCIKVKADTRQQRKETVLRLIGSIESIMQMEERYRDSIPEQFESRIDTADRTCEQLAQAVSCLEEAF